MDRYKPNMVAAKMAFDEKGGSRMGQHKLVDETVIALTADIVAALVSNNNVAVSSLPTAIQTVFGALAGLGTVAVEPEPQLRPAVSIRSSVKPNFIVCLEDGKKMTMLKRYLMTNYGMTPDEYRAKWRLAADYPMAAPNYSERRRALAKQMGLGTNGRRGVRAGK